MALLLKGLYVGTRNETINVPLDQRNRFSLVICVDGALARTYVRVVRLLPPSTAHPLLVCQRVGLRVPCSCKYVHVKLTPFRPPPATARRSPSTTRVLQSRVKRGLHFTSAHFGRSGRRRTRKRSSSSSSAHESTSTKRSLPTSPAMCISMTTRRDWNMLH